MKWFTGHRILREKDGCTIILYLDQYLTEFSSELNYKDEHDNQSNIEESAVLYIKRRLPNIKVKNVKVMLGTLLMASLSLDNFARSMSSPHGTDAHAIISYTVKPSDTLFNIAAQHNMTVPSLSALNHIVSDTIHPGQQIKVKGQQRPHYVVRKGDTLNKIALHTGVTINHLKEANSIGSDVITEEQSLIIPRQEAEIIVKNLPYGVFKEGSKGEAIRLIQHALNLYGFSLQSDGVFGVKTKEVLKVMQKKNNIEALGEYNVLTRQALMRILLACDNIVSNPASTLVLVNKHFRLPYNYIPNNLVVSNVPFILADYDSKKLMRQDMALALSQLFAKAKGDNISLYAVSAYQSYQKQECIFLSNANSKGLAVANYFSAKPGESEHQTGLAVDITSASVNFKLSLDFGKSKEGIWLRENVANFGFIIRYPKGLEHITGYNYEPWHIRYVGEKTAKEVYQKQIALEQYLGYV